MGIVGEDGRDHPTGKSVLLFSGGMDSVMTAWLQKPDVLLYVKHNQRYESQEWEWVMRQLVEGALPPESELASVRLPLGLYERADAIIPLRNLFFVAMAAQYGERILLGALGGDRSRDKNQVFFWRLESMLTYLYGEQHWCEARQMKVVAPYIGETKTSLVRKFLAAGHAPDLLLGTFGCYDPVGRAGADSSPRHCGICKPCFRKWVALKNNGIAVPEGYFASAPEGAPWLSGVEHKVRAGNYRGVEDREWMQALGWGQVVAS